MKLVNFKLSEKLKPNFSLFLKVKKDKETVQKQNNSYNLEFTSDPYLNALSEYNKAIINFEGAKKTKTKHKINIENLKNRIYSNSIYSKHETAKLISQIDKNNADFFYDFYEKVLKVASNKKQEKVGISHFKDFDSFYKIVSELNDENIAIAKQMCFKQDDNDNFVFKNLENIYNTIQNLSQYNLGNLKLVLTKKFGSELAPLLNDMLCSMEINGEEYIDIILNGYNTKEHNLQFVNLTLKNPYDISTQDIEMLKTFQTKEKINGYTEDNLFLACKFACLCKKKSISEIDTASKKKLIKRLVKHNVDLYAISRDFRKDFPLLPRNSKEYCNLVEALTKSVGIPTNDLSINQRTRFYNRLIELKDQLKKLKDKEFEKLSVTQTYKRQDFIKDTYEIIRTLSKIEKAEVFEYFGYELKKNNYGVMVNKRGDKYTISGYPTIPNKKNEIIPKSKRAKNAVENLIPKVKRFTTNNVRCSNDRIEKLLKEIINYFPSIETEIGKLQYKEHNYDLFKHSLRVLKNLVENPEFDKLSGSDQKILLLTALFHDIARVEGYQDPMHAKESAFDSYYITKNLSLSREEQIELNTLIKTHEWLSEITCTQTQNTPRIDRIKSIAYNLHYDNLFELARIFTEADLKAVKKDSSFYKEKYEQFEKCSQEVRHYISELKKSQPLLPATKLPNTDEINKLITKRYEDGKTNLKGIYKDKDGLIIIKYNEVEDETWEEIGLPKGSSTKGIKVKVKANNSQGFKIVETGNIKLNAHGLDYAYQLENFNAFCLPNSEALISFSYMERPETKYRLFRTQGVILDVDTKYLHGGYETDFNSGLKKTLEDFIKKCAFKDSKRHKDRKYISDLIKVVMGITNNVYVSFVDKYKNKSITEIENKEKQTKLVQALCTMNSEKQIGDREYNEMFCTNPTVSAVYAYSENDNIKDPIKFISKGATEIQPDLGFLKEYAIKNHIPFVIFNKK